MGDLSTECHRTLSLYHTDTHHDKVRLHIRYADNLKKIPSYRMDFTNGHFKMNHNGYYRFYADINSETASQLEILRNKLKDVVHTIPEYVQIELTSLYQQNESAWLSLPINERTEYRIVKNYLPFQMVELHFDTVNQIYKFDGSVVVNIPWIKIHNTGVAEPCLYLKDLLITDITGYINPHLTRGFFEKLNLDVNLNALQSVIEYDQLYRS